MFPCIIISPKLFVINQSNNASTGRATLTVFLKKKKMNYMLVVPSIWDRGCCNIIIKMTLRFFKGAGTCTLNMRFP